MLCLPIFGMGQIKSNVDRVNEKSAHKALDLPKRKVKKAVPKPDLPKQKAKKKVTNKTKTSPKIKTVLGEQPTELIAKANIVNVYEVESFVSEEPLDEKLEGFKVLQTAILDKNQAKWIKEMILSEDTYFFSEKKKQCLFLPKMGLQFVHEGDTSNILISFKCDFARFYEGRNPTTLHSDYGHENLMEFFKTVFPIDIDNDFTAQPILLKSNKKQLVKAKQTKPIFYTVQLGDGWLVVAQKATNTLHTKVSVNDLCKWNKVNPKAVQTNKRFLKRGETIIVGFRR